MPHDDRQAIVVDPGDATPVQATLDARWLALGGILVMHRPPDHPASDDRGGLHTQRLRRRSALRLPAFATVIDPIVPLNDGTRILSGFGSALPPGAWRQWKNPR